MDDRRGGRRRRRRPTCASLVRKHWGAPVAARRAVARADGRAARRYPAAATLLCAGLGAVAAVDLVGQPAAAGASAAARSSPDDRAYLHDVARDTWRLFERVVGAEDNHLPPDNLQVAPSDMVAHRTSPTNIGLYLLADRVRAALRLDRHASR